MNDRERKRVEIVTLHKNTTKTVREIADIVGMSKTSVADIIKQYETTGDVSLRYSNCGGSNKKLNDRDLRHMKNICIQSPRLTSRGIQEALGPAGDDISLRTIQRGLIEAGCQAIKPSKCPLLTQPQIAKRYQWAKDHQSWTIDDWKRVMWSDETIIQVIDDCPRTVRLVDGHPLTPDHYLKTVKHPTQIMIWSCFSYAGTGRAHVVEQTLNSEEYISKIIDSCVIPQLHDWYPQNNGIFQQDKAPCHVSKRSIQHLTEHGVVLLPWPPSSPDCNPIENLWSIVKRRIRALQPKTKKDIVTAFLNVWNRDPEIQQMCQKLVESMPDRVLAVLAAKGGATKY